MMNRKQKLKKLLSRRVKEEPKKPSQVVRKLNVSPLISVVEKVQRDVGANKNILSYMFDQKVDEVKGSFEKNVMRNREQLLTLLEDLNSVRGDVNLFNKSVEFIKSEQVGLRKLHEDLDNIQETIEFLLEDTTAEDVRELTKALKELQEDIYFRINRVQQEGGGNMNRQVTIADVDVLTKYTDINFVAGSGMAITAASDNTTKKTDITFTVSGAGGTATETPVGTVDDSNVTFTVSNTPLYINMNGAIYYTGTGGFASYAAPTITLAYPVGTGGFIRSIYSV